MKNTIQLAIVIPAYKAEFLSEALASLVAQSDQRFRVYLGDDASPGPIKEICDRYRQELDLCYHLFPENLGGTSLVDQWHRCIRLSTEPYVWLFSDDDVMEPDCVEAFYATLELTEGKFDLYRFNTLNIDDRGQVISICPPHPPRESGIEFAYHRLCRNRSSFVSEYIFSRRVFDENGGLVKFPLAWCSDDASWISFAGKPGIATIEGPKVYWRNSPINISSVSPATRRKKIEACGLFLQWLDNRHAPEAVAEELKIELRIYAECQQRWLYRQLVTQAPLGPANWLRLASDRHFSCLGSPAYRVFTLACMDLVSVASAASGAVAKLLKTNSQGTRTTGVPPSGNKG